VRGLAELIGWEPSRTDRVLGHPATLDFPAEDVACARCGSSATVYKTTRRTVVTLAQGRIEAREIQRICRGHPEPQVQRSRVLAELVPRGQRYGYDLITRVGCLRFLELCQRREIRARLSIRHGIELSEGTISALSDRFLLHLGALHRDRVAALRQGMRGGYPLHIDGTHYQGSGGLFLCYNGWRGWVLHAGRIDSERIEEIEPIVEQTVSWFGRPVAVVRDQSSACGAAVAFLTDVGVPDLLCHYHVLKNLGKRLLHRAYRRLVALWRVHKGSSTLRALLRRLERADDPAAREVAAAVYWILEGEGKTPPCFPFATPLAGRIERLLSVPQHLGAFASARTRLACKADLDELGELVHAVEAHGELQELLQRLHARKRLFDEARAVFRLADPSNPPDPLLPDIQLLQYRDIEDRVDLWRRDLRRRLLPAKGDLRKAIEAVLEPLDTMHHHLFGHPSP